MFESPTVMLAITAVFASAGVVKGVVGIGLPTISMGLLGVFLAPAQAASLIAIPSIATNVWQLATGPRLGFLLRRLWLLIVGVCVGTWLGFGFLVGPSSHQAAVGVGAVLFAYACFGLVAPTFRVPPRAEPWLTPVVGLTSGFLNGATGIFVIPVAPYLASLGLERDELVQALALTPLVSAIALAVGLVGVGVMGTSLALGSALAVIPAVLGMYVGQLIRQRVSPERFRKVFFGGLALLGAYLVARNF